MGIIITKDYMSSNFKIDKNIGGFTILDFDIWEEINNKFGRLTLEQFAALHLIFSSLITKLRYISKSSISRLLIIKAKYC